MSLGSDDSNQGNNNSKKKPGSDLQLPEKPDGLDEPTGFIDTNQRPKDPVADLYDSLQNARQKNETTQIHEIQDKGDDHELEAEITKFTQQKNPWISKKKASVWGGITVLFLIVYSWGLVSVMQNEPHADHQKTANQGKRKVKQIMEGPGGVHVHHENDGHGHNTRKPTQYNPPRNQAQPESKVKRWQPKRAPVPSRSEREEAESKYNERMMDEGIRRKDSREDEPDDRIPENIKKELEEKAQEDEREEEEEEEPEEEEEYEEEEDEESDDEEGSFFEE